MRSGEPRMRIPSLYFAGILGVGLAVQGCSPKGGGSASSQMTFDTPDAAAESLFKALSRNDTTALLALGGPKSRELVIPADQVQGAHERQVIVAAMMERWWLESDSTGNTQTIVVGNESYPLPIPLVKKNGKWRFDTEAGKQ